MFDEIIKRRKPVPERLISYGFEEIGSLFQYSTEILCGEFTLTVQIGLDGAIDTNLVENETGEMYVLYKTNASGKYVGEVRTAVEKVLCDVVQRCYETAVFKAAQSRRMIEFIRERYGDALEFLWEKFPDNAVWRRKDNQKWYGAILKVPGRKIGLETDKIEEIIDLRMNPVEADSILSRKDHYPGWHMNKRNWYTLMLDGRISDEALKTKIMESYVLAGNQRIAGNSRQ